jgi:hypothetical protein
VLPCKSESRVKPQRRLTGFSLRFNKQRECKFKISQIDRVENGLTQIFHEGFIWFAIYK